MSPGLAHTSSRTGGPGTVPAPQPQPPERCDGKRRNRAPQTSPPEGGRPHEAAAHLEAVLSEDWRFSQKGRDAQEDGGRDVLARSTPTRSQGLNQDSLISAGLNGRGGWRRKEEIRQ